MLLAVGRAFKWTVFTVELMASEREEQKRRDLNIPAERECSNVPSRVCSTAGCTGLCWVCIANRAANLVILYWSSQYNYGIKLPYVNEALTSGF